MKFYYTLSLIAVSITPLIVGCNDKGTVINKGAVVEMIKVEDIDGDEILLEKQSIKRQDYRAFTYGFPKDKVIVEALQKVNREREDGSVGFQHVWLLVDCSNYSFLITSGNISTAQVKHDRIDLNNPYHYEDFVPISAYDNRFKKTVKMICANYESTDQTET